MTKLRQTETPTEAEMDLSIVVPFYNEEKNAKPLYEEIVDCLDKLDLTWEVILVNDGSTDSTLEKIEQLAANDARVVIVDLLTNFGQTAALTAGFDHARGDIVIAMDGDGQNDPAEIPNLLAELDKGFDVVSGWRRDRQDRALTRKIPSAAANWLISKISGVHLHDYGCSLKAYRADVIKSVKLYGEMHRFIPIYISWQGGKVSELAVNHRARMHGSSKYGLNRIFKVLLDLLLVSFMQRYMTKPIYVFGGIGMAFLVSSFLVGAWALLLKLFAGISFVSTPLPILFGMFFTSGVLCFLMGLLAELMMRTYFEAQDKTTYQLKNRRPKTRS